MRKALSIFAIFPIFLFAQDLVWETEGVILSDPTIHNVEVIPLPADAAEYADPKDVLADRYRMYFQQNDQIKSAISTDGKTFALESGERLPGAMPSLIKLPDKGWRMYFKTQEDDQGVLKSAISSDAFNWTIEEGVRLAGGGEFDPDNIAHPTVVTRPEGGYRMYYNGEVRRTEQDFTWRLLSATSPDGISWTKDPGVRVNVGEGSLDADSVGSAHAEYYALTQTYQILFSVQSAKAPNGIYRATSQDGLLFTISPEPEFAPPEEIGEPFVFNFSGTKRMYYWVGGSGIYSAVLKRTSEVRQTNLGGWLENLWEKIRTLPQKINLQLPKNPELYIVPTVLLAIGLGAVIYLWRSRLRR